MSVTTRLAPIAMLAALVALPSIALANSTGNENNNPAYIQRPILPEQAAPPVQHHATLHQRQTRSGACSFLGSEAGNRNPDAVHCTE